MFKNEYISASLAILLFSALTLSDTRTLVFELEEVEGREIKVEEEKQEGEGQERFGLKLLNGGASDSVLLSISRVLNTHRSAVATTVHTVAAHRPLYITFCCQKIPSC